MAMMGKFAYHVTIRNAASAVYAKICESINDNWGTNLNRKFMKLDESFINYNFLGFSNIDFNAFQIVERK